jgi:fibronectin type 3 domain-containing protein
VAVTDMGLREATVKWRADGGAASRYRVERALAEEGPFAVVGETKPSRGSFRDDQGLKDAAVYYYRVVAVGDTGLASKPSPVVETMTAPPPDPPAEVKAHAPSSRCVAVSWTPPRAEAVVKYRVERAEAGAVHKWCLRGETEKTSFIDGGRAGCDVADSTKYLYRVTAVNRVGAVGEPSAGVEVETLPPPAVVADFFAAPLQVRCVPLSWAANPEPDVEGYELERAEGAAGAFVKLERIRGRGTTTFLDGRRDPGNLPDAQTYRYRIRAFNDVGAFGEWTPPAEATTRSVPPPPQGVAAAGGMPRAAEVSWTVSEDEKVVAYRVLRAEGPDGRWEDVAKVAGRESVRLLDRAGAAATAPTGRLKDGTGYRYRVCAINTADAESAWSEEALAVTKPAPVPPAGLGTTDDVAGKVVLVWEPNPEADVVAYVVASRAADGSRWREVARVERCAAEEAGLDAGEHRVYRIKAVDADTHESAWSAEVAGAARPLPASPKALNAAWAGGGATLTWRPPREGMAEYRLYKKGLFSSERIATSREPEAALDAAAVGKRITVYVTAVDEEGLESRPSEPLEIRPPAETAGG